MIDGTSEDRPQSEQFESFSVELLQAGLRVRFQARGASMSPAIRDGEMVYVRPATEANLCQGDIVLVKGETGFRLHRLIRGDVFRDVFVTRGDCGQQEDPPVRREQILGVVVGKDVRVGRGMVTARFNGALGEWLRCLARGQAVLSRVACALWSWRTISRSALRRGTRDYSGGLGLLFLVGVLLCR